MPYECKGFETAQVFRNDERGIRNISICQTYVFKLILTKLGALVNIKEFRAAVGLRERMQLNNFYLFTQFREV